MKNELQIRAENPIVRVVIRNVLGQTLKTFTRNAYETSIDLSDLSAGNYLMTVSLENGDRVTGKVLK